MEGQWQILRQHQTEVPDVTSRAARFLPYLFAGSLVVELCLVQWAVFSPFCDSLHRKEGFCSLGTLPSEAPVAL